MLLPSSPDSSGDGVGSADDARYRRQSVHWILLSSSYAMVLWPALVIACHLKNARFTITFVPMFVYTSVTFYCTHTHIHTHSQTHTYPPVYTHTFVTLYSVSRHMLVMGHCVCWTPMQMDIQILLSAHAQMKTLPCTVRLTLVATPQTQTRQIFHHVLVTWQVQF